MRIYVLIAVSCLISFSSNAKELLDWPLELNHKTHQFGAGFLQYVSFGDKYFHLGQDIVAEAGTLVKAPISGKVEGGYYTYVDPPNGQSIKTFIPLKSVLGDFKLQEELATYFEVAIIDENGRRYELHHVNANTLPMKIRSAILSGGRIEAGDVVGKVIARGHHQFGIEYDHIHYNVVDPDGAYINPFSVSKKIKDDLAPVIKNIFYRDSTSTAKCNLHPGTFLKEARPEVAIENVEYIVFKSSDKISNNKIPQALTKLRADFEGDTPVFEYDFSKKISSKFDIREIYFDKMCIGDPEYPINLEGTTNTNYYYKVPIPKGYTGKVIISAYDYAENKTSKVFLIN